MKLERLWTGVAVATMEEWFVVPPSPSAAVEVADQAL